MTLRNWLHANPWMTAGIGLQLVLAILACVGLMLDKREVLGLNAWIKPLKFDLSVFIMLVTLAVFLSALPRYDTLRLWIGGSLAVSLTVENFLISLQALRGVRSHMNYSSAFDAYVFMGMGIMVGVATLAMAVTLWLYFADKPLWPAAVTWGIRLGLLMLLAGSVEGVLMVRHGGHTIGAVDGLGGLPFTNWSRSHGDLRVAHFFALHAVQAFPILGYLLSRTTLAERVQVGGVFGGAAFYTIAVWLLFKQAMEGRPVLG